MTTYLRCHITEGHGGSHRLPAGLTVLRMLDGAQKAVCGPQRLRGWKEKLPVETETDEVNRYNSPFEKYTENSAMALPAQIMLPKASKINGISKKICGQVKVSTASLDGSSLGEYTQVPF